MLHRSRKYQLNFIMTVIGLMHNAIYTGDLCYLRQTAQRPGAAMLFCLYKKIRTRSACPWCTGENVLR